MVGAKSLEPEVYCLEWKKSDAQELQMIACGDGRDGDDDDDESSCAESQSDDDVATPLAIEYCEHKNNRKKASLFSQKEDVILLQEMVKFRESEKDELKTNWIKFHMNVYEKLSSNVSKAQIIEKFRGLKKKMESNIRRNSWESLQGDEARIFELSRSLWPHDPAPKQASRKRKRKGKEEVSPGKPLDPAHYPRLKALFEAVDSGLSKGVRDSWTLIGSEAAEKLEKQQSSIIQKEIGLDIERDNFNIEISRMVLEQIK